MNSIHIVSYGYYNFGSIGSLSDGQLEQLTINLNSPSAGKEGNILGGRIPVMYIDLEAMGPVAVKTYARGGYIRHINKQWYMKLGKTRCQKEFENIIKLRSLGISAPEPITFAYSKGMFYRAWLVTKEIRGHQTLANISITDGQRTGEIMNKVINQVRMIIKSGIHHVDLHAGNILVSHDDEVFIVDLDKAYKYKGPEDSLKRKYIARWQRAVAKHGLPKMLAERFIDL